MSPALGMHPGMGSHLQQIQAHLLRNAAAAAALHVGAAPPPPPPPAPPQAPSHHPHMHVPGHTQLYPAMSPPHTAGVPGSLPPPTKAEAMETSCRKASDASTRSAVTAAEADTSSRRACSAKVKREPATTTTPSAPTINHHHHHHHHHHPQNLSPSDDLRDEPGDFIETNCHWKDCNLEFPTQVIYFLCVCVCEYFFFPPFQVRTSV